MRFLVEKLLQKTCFLCQSTFNTACGATPTHSPKSGSGGGGEERKNFPAFSVVGSTDNSVLGGTFPCESPSSPVQCHGVTTPWRRRFPAAREYTSLKQGTGRAKEARYIQYFNSHT